MRNVYYFLIHIRTSLCTPTLLERLKCEFKSENNRRKKKVGVHSLICNTSGVEGCVGAQGWGLRWMTSGSIIHTNLHKPNNWLVNSWLVHFDAQTNHMHPHTHKTHHGPNLGEATTFPLIVFSTINHMGYI